MARESAAHQPGNAPATRLAIAVHSAVGMSVRKFSNAAPALQVKPPLPLLILSRSNAGSKPVGSNVVRPTMEAKPTSKPLAVARGPLSASLAAGSHPLITGPGNVSDITPTSVVISWEPATTIDFADVEEVPTGNYEVTVDGQTYTVAGTSVFVSGLTPNTTYYYSVSAEYIVTTSPLPPSPPPPSPLPPSPPPPSPLPPSPPPPSSPPPSPPYSPPPSPPYSPPPWPPSPPASPSSPPASPWAMELAARTTAASEGPALAFASSGGLRPFIDLRPPAMAASTTAVVSSTARPAGSITALDTSEIEYLPYTSGEFNTGPLSISGPDGFTSIDVGDTSATIQWNAASDNEYPIAGYNVEYRPAGSANWTSAGFTTGIFTSVGGLSPDTAYDVQAEAVDTQGNVGSWSEAPSLFTTAALPWPTLVSPANLVTGQSTTPTFTWAPLAGAAGGYRIFVDTNRFDLPTLPTGGAGPTAVFADQLAGTSDAPASALEPDTTYYWEVQGISGAAMPGAWSSIGTFTTSGIAFTVSGNGGTIMPGPSPASPADGTDFGNAVVGSSPVRETFTIRNTGNESLTLGRLKAPAGFTIVSEPPRALAVGHSATFKVRLNSTKLGTFAGPVSFSNNDPSTAVNPFTFNISGTVIPKPAPVLSVLGNGQPIRPGRAPASAADGTDFGTVPQASAAAPSTFTIENTGNAALTLGRIRVPRGFTVISEPPRFIAAGAIATFTIGLNTARPGTFRGVVSFPDNDPRAGEHPFAFVITGIVTPTAPGTR